MFDLAGCLADGRRAAAAALDGLGVAGPDVDAPVPWRTAPERTPTAVMWRVPDTDGAARAVQFVDLQRDATVADIARAVGAGLRTVEHIKRYTTIGTAHDQGKTSGVIASGIAAELLRPAVEDARHHHVPAAVHPGRLRRARRTRPRVAVRPRAHHRRARLAPRAGRGLGGRRPVEAPALLPAAG